MIATSGTAFTEHQVALLRRHTSQLAVNFDPDAAGANAAEKSIALLTEEGFTIKIVTLEDGLDPDRYIRERGVEAYTRAIRGARRQSDYLIERARMLFPGATAEQKVKAMNFLLPHIRRMPEKLSRDQFASDAAQKLGIDSTILREQLRQAALRRQDHIEVRASALTEVERVLLRALSIDDPEHQDARALAAGAIMQEPAWFEGLTTFPAMQALAGRRAQDPMETVARRRPARAAGPGAARRNSGADRSGSFELHPAGAGSGHRAPPAGAARPHCRGGTPWRPRRAGHADAAEAGVGPCAEVAAQPAPAGVRARTDSLRALRIGVEEVNAPISGLPA